MNCLFIAPRLHTNLYHQVIALQNAGNRVMVAVLYKGKSEYDANITYVLLPLSLFSKCITGILRLFRKSYLKTDLELRFQSPGKELKGVFRDFKPDVVILKAYQNMLALKVLRLSKAFGTKVLMHTQTDKTTIFGSTFLFKLNMHLFKMLRVFAYITPVLSNYEKFKSFGIDIVYYLPFVYPVPRGIEPKKLTENDAVRILSIGKYTKRKDHLTLIQAIEELHADGLNVELSVYGELADPGYFKELTRHIASNHSEGYIRLFENIGYDKIPDLYSNHHVFILPAYNEPAAFSIVEAMAYGLPVICSDQNGTKCYIFERQNGYVFKAKNKDDLLQKIKGSVIDNAHYIRLSRGASDLALKHHSLESFELELSRIINHKNTCSDGD